VAPGCRHWLHSEMWWPRLFRHQGAIAWDDYEKDYSDLPRRGPPFWSSTSSCQFHALVRSCVSLPGSEPFHMHEHCTTSTMMSSRVMGEGGKINGIVTC
jgi:hypothetical protein